MHSGIRALLLSVPLALHVFASGPVSYDVGSDFKFYYPGYREQKKGYTFQLKKLEKVLRAQEAAGKNVTYSNQIDIETGWLIRSTVDYPRTEARLKALEESLAMENPPEDEQSEVDGMWGVGYTEKYLRLAETYDRLVSLNSEGKVPKYPAKFLDEWNSPEALREKLDALLVSDIQKLPVRKRSELNETISDIMRLILGGIPSNYPFHPKLKEALLDYLDHHWQKADTGFWGAWYQSGKNLVKTDDLSLTFHIVRYRRGEVDHWPEIISTLLAMKKGEYPFGWLEDGERTTHDLYDVVALMHMGWPHMTDSQKQECRKEIRKTLDWCLKKVVTKEGSFEMSDADDSIEDGVYFGVSFLSEIGYFNPANRFWTDEKFPEAEALRMKIKAWIEARPHKGTEYLDALEKLGQ